MMMNFRAYQVLAAQTAVYPPGLVYPVLGLNGEAGEVAEKVKKILRDQDGVVSEQNIADLTKELGDVLWYVAAVATELGLNLDDIARLNIQKLQSRQTRGVLHGNGDSR